MNRQPFHILGIAGSLREGSFNRKALRIALDLASGLGADVHELDLRTLDLPVFNADLREHGFPPPAAKLKTAIASADILLMATPEYNHSVPGPLKNAIDWASDKTNPFEGKTAALFGASTGVFGTLRAQLHLRQILASLGVFVVPQPQVYIRSARDAFLPDGSFADPGTLEHLRVLLTETIKLAASMRTVSEGTPERVAPR
jgi:chromate reductase